MGFCSGEWCLPVVGGCLLIAMEEMGIEMGSAFFREGEVV